MVVSKVQRYNGVLAVTPGDSFFLLGSHFDLEGDARHLLSALPAVVLIDAEAQSASVKWAVKRILQEMQDPRPGGTLVAQQVASTLLVDTLRIYLEKGEAHGSGWLSALADSTMRTALAHMHGNPAHGWTLEELARSTGLSRTVFAKRFRKTVGETPIAYLTRWRLTLAAERMRGGLETLSTIASLVGYQSDSSFCAAFKRHWGTSPKQYAAKSIPISTKSA